MHYVYFVITPKQEGEDSLAVRTRVSSWLEEEGFCSQGMYSQGKADWFVIGGRWSGILGGGNGVEERDSFEELGYEDDAQIVSLSLLARLQEKYADVRVADTEESEEYYLSEVYEGGWKLDNERWIVVVDYHS